MPKCIKTFLKRCVCAVCCVLCRVYVKHFECKLCPGPPCYCLSRLCVSCFERFEVGSLVFKWHNLSYHVHSIPGRSQPLHPWCKEHGSVIIHLAKSNRKPVSLISNRITYLVKCIDLPPRSLVMFPRPLLQFKSGAHHPAHSCSYLPFLPPTPLRASGFTQPC